MIFGPGVDMSMSSDGNRTAAATTYSDQLDPRAEQLLRAIKDQGYPGWAYLTIEQGRAMMASMRPFAGDPEPVAHVEDIVIPHTPDIAARAYLSERGCRVPLIVYFHGISWTCRMFRRSGVRT